MVSSEEICFVPWGIISFDLCKAEIEQISGAALAHNGSQQVKGQGQSFGGISGAVPNWANSSRLFSIPLIQGVDNPVLVPSHMLKCLMEGWGTAMPLPPPQVLAWERLVERWLCGCPVLAGCTAAGTRACAWCVLIHHILEKHHSETCKLLHPSVILVMLTENRFLADFFFSLAVLNFALKMRRGKARLQGEGRAETFAN